MRGVEGEHEIVFVGRRVQMGVDTVIEMNIDFFLITVSRYCNGILIFQQQYTEHNREVVQDRYGNIIFSLLQFLQFHTVIPLSVPPLFPLLFHSHSK